MERKISISFLLLGVLPFLPFIVRSELYWIFHIVIFFMILIEYKVFVKAKECSYLWLLGLPLVWSFIISFNDSINSIFKALFYLSTPLAFTAVGMLVAQIATPKMVLKYVVYSGTVGALLYIGMSLNALGFRALAEPYEMRKLFLWGSITNVIAVFIVLFSQKYGVILYKKRIHKIILLAINILALYLTASRTYYVLFLIFLFVFLYKKNKKIIFFIGGGIFIAFNVFVNLNSDSEFQRKISSGVNELQWGNYKTEEDINTKYRGYESYMALKTYNSGTALNLLFGHGFEKNVDLETYVKLGGDDYRNIPIVHNGYIFQLLREGIIGLILTLIFLIKVLRIVAKSSVLNLLHLIIIGVILSLLFSNYLENTFFSTEMLQVWLLTGAFLVYVYKERRLKKINPITITKIKGL
jgi:hypothetical protein